MGLSSDILKDFAGLVNKDRTEDKSKKFTTAYGTTVVIEDVKYVQLDGSDSLTPISEATEAEDGDRVLIEVKNHKATVIGNFTAPPSLRDSQEALEKAENAQGASDEAMEQLQDAKDAATKAEESANAASQKAQEALDKAEQSQQASQQAQTLIGEANTKIDVLEEEIKNVTADTDAIREEIKADLPAIIDETVSAEYAKKTDLVEVKGELEGSINMTAGELQTEMKEHYVTQSELVKMEEYLNTKINQNSEEIALTASRTSQLETDTEDIKALLRAAQDKVRVASQTASEAKDAANAAERELAKAEESLTEAQDNLTKALEYYDQVSNKDDATEEEIYEAQNAVVDAELAVDKATADAEAAQAAADAAIADAQAAEEALEQAKQELSEVASSVTEMQAQIQLNAEAIEMRVTEEKLTETLEEGYYNKTETESLIKQSSDGITLEVTSKVENNISDKYATKDELADATAGDIDIGGRNMCLGTSSEWTEIVLGADYVTVMRFKMADLVEKYGLVDEDMLTYSIDLKTDSGKQIAAGWQKYNDSVDRYGTNSEDTIIASNGRSCVHPIIDTTYEYLDLMVVNLSTNLTEDTTEYYRCLQLEKGNVPTDWTPAPEDNASGEELDSTQDNLGETNNKLDNVDKEVIETKTKIELLEGTISMLITDENGNSLMTQTSTGWTFNISGIQENVANNSDDVAKLQELIGTLSAQTGSLENAVENLEETSEYIWITTYEDEPCIALGESDSDYGLFITNTRIIFIDGSGNPTYISKDGLYTNKLTVGSEFRQKNYMWSVRSNGNYGLIWKQIKANSILAIYSGGDVAIGTELTELTGLTVRVYYSDGTSANTTDYTLSGSIALGDNTITVSYSGLTDTFIVTAVMNIPDDVEMADASRCTVASWASGANNYSTSVSYADSIEVVNGEITLTPLRTVTLYPTTMTNSSNNNYENLLGKYVESFNGDIYYIDPSSAYTHATNVSSYVAESIYYSTAYKITATGSSVKQLTSISATYTGDSVTVGTPVSSLTGITVTASYSDGSTSNVTDYTLSGSIAEGNNTITVSYSGLTTTFTVTGVAETEEDDEIVLGEATTCVATAWATTTSTGSKIEYSDSVEVVDSAVSLVNPQSTTFYMTTAANHSSNNYNILLGKYIKAFNGSIYYVDPASTYNHKTNVSTFVKENIVYNTTYLVTVA